MQRSLVTCPRFPSRRAEWQGQVAPGPAARAQPQDWTHRPVSRSFREHELSLHPPGWANTWRPGPRAGPSARAAVAELRGPQDLCPQFLLNQSINEPAL